ncbi:Tetratricopeptide repeat-containing domain [Ceraceosorus bombacis]|uniref:Tetratricopeptide repeat-containing domain n=1 Tax=Ceraceosorus bombacis TaxID=401625 RepID=A0A0P1BFU9_9BASI|nr:Tetratricopeptide repeat-containing domain [Ceraceosorus bombacis]
MATVAAIPRPSKRSRTTSKALTLDQLPNDPAELQSKLLELSGNVLSEALEMLFKHARETSNQTPVGEVLHSAATEALYRVSSNAHPSATAKGQKQEATRSPRRCGTFNDGTFTSEDYAQLVRCDTYRVDALSLVWREVPTQDKSRCASKTLASVKATQAHQDAARLARAALQLLPDEPKAYYRAAEALRACGQGQQALKAIEKSPRTSPRDASSWNYAFTQLQARLDGPTVNLLSDDTLSAIFAQLPLRTLNILGEVCPRWRSVVETPELSRHLTINLDNRDWRKAALRECRAAEHRVKTWIIEPSKNKAAAELLKLAGEQERTALKGFFHLHASIAKSGAMACLNETHHFIRWACEAPHLQHLVLPKGSLATRECTRKTAVEFRARVHDRHIPERDLKDYLDWYSCDLPVLPASLSARALKTLVVPEFHIWEPKMWASLEHSLRHLRVHKNGLLCALMDVLYRTCQTLETLNWCFVEDAGLMSRMMETCHYPPDMRLPAACPQLRYLRLTSPPGCRRAPLEWHSLKECSFPALEVVDIQLGQQHMLPLSSLPSLRVLHIQAAPGKADAIRPWEDLKVVERLLHGWPEQPPTWLGAAEVVVHKIGVAELVDLFDTTPNHYLPRMISSIVIGASIHDEFALRADGASRTAAPCWSAEGWVGFLRRWVALRFAMHRQAPKNVIDYICDFDNPLPLNKPAIQVEKKQSGSPFSRNTSASNITPTVGQILQKSRIRLLEVWQYLDPSCDPAASTPHGVRGDAMPLRTVYLAQSELNQIRNEERWFNEHGVEFVLIKSTADAA